jgi:hypothetical protein
MFCLAPVHLSPFLFNHIAPLLPLLSLQTARFWDCPSHPRTSLIGLRRLFLSIRRARYRRFRQQPEHRGLSLECGGSRHNFTSRPSPPSRSEGSATACFAFLSGGSRPPPSKPRRLWHGRGLFSLLPYLFISLLFKACSAPSPGLLPHLSSSGT